MAIVAKTFVLSVVAVVVVAFINPFASPPSLSSSSLTTIFSTFPIATFSFSLTISSFVSSSPTLFASSLITHSFPSTFLS